MTRATQQGLVVTLPTHHAQMPREAYIVRDWRDSHQPKTQETARQGIRDAHLYAEAVFDAAHGRRYLLFVYADQAGRKACWDCLTGEAENT